MKDQQLLKDLFGNGYGDPDYTGYYPGEKEEADIA